jgi:hypothetical protein
VAYDVGRIGRYAKRRQTMTRLQDPAFYLLHLDGSALENTIADPNTGERQPAFFLWSSIQKVREYARLDGSDLRGFTLMSFETVEDVERFVEEHRDFYQWVVVNPKLGLRSGMEPFERLVDMARSLAVE